MRPSTFIADERLGRPDRIASDHDSPAYRNVLAAVSDDAVAGGVLSVAGAIADL